MTSLMLQLPGGHDIDWHADSGNAQTNCEYMGTVDPGTLLRYGILTCLPCSFPPQGLPRPSSLALGRARQTLQGQQVDRGL